MELPPPKSIARKPVKRRRTSKPKGKRVLKSPKLAEGAPRPIGERPNAGVHPTRAAIPRKIQSLSSQVDSWVDEALIKMGAPELAGKVPWAWNKPMTRVMGRAFLQQRRIEFSPELFGRATETQRRETVFHECAHLVDWHQGTYVSSSSHGESFKRVMRRAGYPGERCHHVKVVQRKDRNKRKHRLKGMRVSVP